MSTSTFRILICALSVGVLPRLATAQEGASSAADTAAPKPSSISGRVADHESALGIPGALVSLTSASGGPASVRRRGTNRDGRFFYSNLSAGTYFLTIDHFGYRSLHDTVSIPPGSELRMHAELSAAPIKLEPVVVVVRSRAHPLTVIPGLEHRKRLGQGTFIGRKEIEQQKPFYVSDLLRVVPGVRLFRDQDLGYAIRLRGGCTPSVWIDGNRTDATDVDLLLRPSDIQQVEVYRGAQLPPRFGSNPCGAVAFWTRSAERRPGQSATWKKVLISAAVVGVLFLGGH